ncbi:MAG: rpmE [Candidatus Saganbacteria bacterium]|uniref:Large ribosomal subunit protein bL31 n=1 Tax=Candidatus Saganbacteria bacterium TaxID=2575572 RepID=A0A833NWH3_UNCSA|nr:MAG: rpmE [Candidatus Saganbacteria bacterium]
MKDEIHPKYFKTMAVCACGAKYEIGSTKENVRVDICSNCHPLFTGKQKLLDLEGRVQKFKKKYANVKAKPKTAKKKKLTVKKKSTAKK